MKRAANAVEIFTHLDKSNCRECGEKTCLAFAVAVLKSRKRMNQCTRIDRETLQSFATNDVVGTQNEMGQQLMDKLINELSQIDMAETAKRIGGVYDGHKLSVHMLGKRIGPSFSCKAIVC